MGYLFLLTGDSEASATAVPESVVRPDEGTERGALHGPGGGRTTGGGVLLQDPRPVTDSVCTASDALRQQLCACVCVCHRRRAAWATRNLAPLLTGELGQTSRFAPVPFRGLF